MSLARAEGRGRRSTPVFAAFAVLFAALVAEGLHAILTRAPETARITASAALVGRIGLTDLALFTEARYTRNPAMADLNSAFQDGPMAFEHFPSGTFVPVPTNFGRGALGFDEAAVRR